MKTLSSRFVTKWFFPSIFLRVDFFVPQSGHQREIQSVLGPDDTCLVRA